MAAALIRLWDTPPLTIDHAPGAGDAMVISFASVGHDPARAPSPEFLRCATAGGRPALFVSDTSRSWANAPGFAPALRHALQRATPAGPRRLATLGASMGGFAALAAATVLPVDVVLAIGPQFSVHPGQMPTEHRWRDWTARIADWRFPTAPLPEGPWIILLHGLADDADQARAFPQRKGIDHLLFPGLAHSGLAPHLKARGVLQGLIDTALSGDRRRLLRIASGAGGMLRAKHPDLLEPDPDTPDVRGWPARHDPR